jgi:hypothetical protein
MGKAQALGDAQYTVIGRRYGSDDIAAEAIRAKACWARDVGLLATYGYGQAALVGFDGLLTEHARMRESRPEVIAAKRSVVRERAGVVASGRAWVNQAVSLLETRAREDQRLAERLNAAVPADSSGLDASVGALSKLLTEQATSLPPDANVDALIGQGANLLEDLRAAPGTVTTAKSAKVADTADLDRLDGRLYVAMRDLNRAGRRAIRAGKLGAAPTDYRFAFRRSAGKEPTPPAPNA